METGHSDIELIPMAKFIAGSSDIIWESAQRAEVNDFLSLYSEREAEVPSEVMQSTKVVTTDHRGDSQ